MKLSLEKALQGLKNQLCDLTSLQVQTYVGEIEVVLDGVSDATDFEASLKNARQEGKIKLSLVTKIHFDGDGVVLVPSSAPAGYIQEAHDAAVKAGHEVRQGLVALFSDVVGLKK